MTATLQMDDKTQAGNSTYPKVAVQWLNQALCFYKSFCLFGSEALQNPQLYIAETVTPTFKKYTINP